MSASYQSQVLDHLGLVAGMFDELGIGESIDQAIAQDRTKRTVSLGHAVKAMVLNGLGFVNGCRSHIDVGTLRHAAADCPVMCVSRLTGPRHSGRRVFSHAPHTPEGSPHASIAEPCLLVQ